MLESFSLNCSLDNTLENNFNILIDVINYLKENVAFCSIFLQTFMSQYFCVQDIIIICRSLFAAVGIHYHSYFSSSCYQDVLDG